MSIYSSLEIFKESSAVGCLSQGYNYDWSCKCFDEDKDMNNRSMPPGIIIPELAYPDLETAADWLCAVLGFKQRLIIGNHRIQLVLDGASMVATAASSRYGQDSLDHAVMLRVSDVDGHYRNARKLGADILNPPADYPYGERQYSLRDPGGHVWTISQSIADVDPRVWGGTLL